MTRCTAYAELQTWQRDGRRWAEPARAVVDAARAQPSLRDVRGLVLGAASASVVTPEELREVLEGGQRNGSALVRRAISDAERGCASPPEAEVVDALVGRGVPFLVNSEFWWEGRLLGSPDLWLVGSGTTGEVESTERHDGAQDRENTYDRHEHFTAAGMQPVHLSVRRIRADANEAADYLLQRHRVGPTQPPGLVVVPRGPILS